MSRIDKTMYICLGLIVATSVLAAIARIVIMVIQ